jgi:hypothetical protein
LRKLTLTITIAVLAGCGTDTASNIQSVVDDINDQIAGAYLLKQTKEEQNGVSEVIGVTPGCWMGAMKNSLEDETASDDSYALYFHGRCTRSNGTVYQFQRSFPDVVIEDWQAIEFSGLPDGFEFVSMEFYNDGAVLILKHNNVTITYRYLKINVEG